MVADVQFEPMQVCHLDAVVHIEQQVFTNPWTRRDFEFSLERENAYCRVVEIEEVLIGYVIGFVIQKEFHLADFSVHPNYQRRGIGNKMMAVLCDELQDLAQVISLEVRMSNVAAIELYKKTGFQTMAIRNSYYSNPVEDALVMLRPLNGHLSDWVTEALANRS